MDHIQLKRVSIQVSLDGYSFNVQDPFSSPQVSSSKTVEGLEIPDLQGEGCELRLSAMTPKVSLVPVQFFDADSSREMLERTVDLDASDEVGCVEVPEFSAVLLYSLSGLKEQSDRLVERLSRPGKEPLRVLPEMYYVLMDVVRTDSYNKIVASYTAPYLHLAVAQGRNLLLSNVYEAVDFTTAEYFIFNALKKLQLNPEVSTISFRTPLSEEEEMSLYRYFKGVERL